MGKDTAQTTTQTQNQSQTGSASNGIDQASQDYITQFLRPLGQNAAETIQGLGGLPGLNETFRQGVGGVQDALSGSQAVQQQLGGFQQGLGGIGGDLRRYRPDVGELGFQQSAIDPAQANQLFQASLNASRQGVNPANFNPNSVQNFFNPYEQSVVGGIQANADRQREQALSRAASEATSRGAFGGSRSGVLQSESLRNVNQDEANLVAQTRNQGYQAAQQAALQAHGIDTNADIAGRAQGLQALQTGLGAADINQRGQIASNQIGLGAAEAAQQGRIAEQGFGLNRALGLQDGQISAAGLGLQGIQTGLQGIGQQAGIAQNLAGLGATEQQVGAQNQQFLQNQQLAALQAGNMGFGQVLGQNSQFDSSGFQSGSTTQKQEGNLFNDLLGAGLTVGGFLLGGPAGAAAGNQLGGAVSRSPLESQQLSMDLGVDPTASFTTLPSTLTPQFANARY